MIRKTICGIAACVLLGSLLGCAKASEPLEPMQSMDKAQMIATASQPATETAGQTLRESLDAPQRVEIAALPTLNERFSVAILANVSVPEADHLSVYRVSAAEFSQEFLSKAFDYFCKGQTMYDYGNLFKSKNDIQGRIDSMQRDLDMNDSPDGPNGGDAWRKEFKAEIASFKLDLLTAQDGLGAPITKAAFTQNNTVGDGRQETFGAVDAPEQPWTKQFFVSNNIQYPTDEVRYIAESDTTVAPRSEAGFHYYDTARVTSNLYKLVDVTHEARTTELDKTPAEALQEVAALLHALGINDLAPYRVCLAREFQENSSESGKYAYYVEARRIVNGVSVQSPFQRTYVNGFDDGHEWAYEALDVRLDDEGIIGMNWVSPLKVGAVEVEHATLLPFSSILDVAKNMLCVANERLDADLNGYDQYAIQINLITLSLQRIPNTGSIDSGLLVPVWNFYGTESYIQTSGVEVSRMSDESIGLRDEPFLSINAIDGSVIDKIKGY